MNVQFIAGMAVITPDPGASRKLYVDALGLPLTAAEGDDYLHSEQIGGSRHFGVWPLAQAAQACFGTPDWPADRPVPQASVEFEVADPDAVQAAAEELRDAGPRAAARRPHGAVGPDRRPPAVAGGRGGRHLLRAVVPRRGYGRRLNPRSSSCWAWRPGSGECSSTTPRRRPFRRAAATRQRPAWSVKPVLTPSVPG